VNDTLIFFNNFIIKYVRSDFYYEERRVGDWVGFSSEETGGLVEWVQMLRYGLRAIIEHEINSLND
jgi:hypothetical protein